MNINAIEELSQVLADIDAKIKHLESSPNRVFVLVEYDTLSLFHYYNEFFKQYWNEFDRNSAGQLLRCLEIIKKHTELSDRYEELFREQLDYLKGIIDFDNKCLKDLPPVIFSEDNGTDIIDYYKDCFKDYKDENGKPFFEINVEREGHYDYIDGVGVPMDFYMLRSEKINNEHYNGLLGMYHCLDSIFTLMCKVCSYPNDLLSGYKPNNEDIISALDKELRQYAKEIGKKVERDLRKIAQSLKSSRNAPLTPDVWGQVMQVEDDLFDLAIKGELEDNTEKRFEHIYDDQRKQWSENYPLLQKIKTACLDGELFDIRLSIETHQLLSSLNADNLDLFYELVLRRNIIQREMFPDALAVKYEEWVNMEEQRPDNDKDTGAMQDENAPVDGEVDEETVVAELKPIFYNNEEDVRKFLKEIRGMATEDITDLVNRWVDEKRISNYGNSRKGLLWGILHKAKLYSKSRSNWNGRVK